MKSLLITLCLGCLLFLGACSDDDNVDLGNNNSSSNGGGGNSGQDSGNNPDANLQKFVLNNCGKTSNDEPLAINGATFPDNETEDPTQSAYTRNCLNQ